METEKMSFEEGLQSLKNQVAMLEKGNLPDGIVCYNDQIAVQVMEELEKAAEKNE